MSVFENGSSDIATASFLFDNLLTYRLYGPFAMSKAYHYGSLDFHK